MNRLAAKSASLFLIAAALITTSEWHPRVLAQDNRSPVVRCAVIGGLNEIDFWPQLADRFEQLTGTRLEIAATGPKHVIAETMKTGEADVIVMHNCDTLMNLVADGLAENPQPWARNDFVIVGPASDPAKIRHESDAVVAIRRIMTSRCRFMLHSSNGANELVSDLLAVGGLELDPTLTISLPADKYRQMLRRAGDEQAYTLVGRIPFITGKVDRGELEIMVQGDERLRRPYVVAVATQADALRMRSARRLAAFLRERETQKFIAEFGVGRYDQRPLLFPVTVP